MFLLFVASGQDEVETLKRQIKVLQAANADYKLEVERHASEKKHMRHIDNAGEEKIANSDSQEQ